MREEELWFFLDLIQKESRISYPGLVVYNAEIEK